MAAIENSFLWMVACIPGSGGAAPDAAFQLQLQDGNDLSLFDSGSGGVSATAQTVLPGANSAGIIPPFFATCSFVCGTLGNANTSVFYLYFLKGM